MQTALADSMLNFATGNTWCEACDVFFPHDPNVNQNLPTHGRWEACTQGELASILGPPPDASLRLDAASCGRCGTNRISDANGTCVSCNVDGNRERVVGNQCVQCPPGFFVGVNSDQCFECNAASITPPSGNFCQGCPFPQRANRATNTCGDCPPDAVADVGLYEEDGLCTNIDLDISPSAAPGDLCPNAYWLEVQNVGAIAAGGPKPSVLDLPALAFSNLTGAACTSSTVSFRQDNERTQAGGQVHQTGAVRSRSGIECGVSTPLCTNTGFSCIYDFGPIQAISAEEIASTGLTNLRVALSDFQGPIGRLEFGTRATNLCRSPD
jgi:hypothetical protein